MSVVILPSNKLSNACSFVKSIIDMIGHGAWKSQTTKTTEGHNTKPETRMGHTAVYDPTVRAVYLFGGSKNLKWFSDVHILDTDEWKWQIVKVSCVLYVCFYIQKLYFEMSQH